MVYHRRWLDPTSTVLRAKTLFEEAAVLQSGRVEAYVELGRLAHQMQEMREHAQGAEA